MCFPAKDLFRCGHELFDFNRIRKKDKVADVNKTSNKTSKKLDIKCLVINEKKRKQNDLLQLSALAIFCFILRVVDNWYFK